MLNLTKIKTDKYEIKSDTIFGTHFSIHRCRKIVHTQVVKYLVITTLGTV